MHNIYEGSRKCYIQLNEIYFWTATIHNWEKIFNTDEDKNIIIDSLAYLSNNNIIDVFAFVIMPNHIHLIWRINSLNGKETAQGSLLKFTAHSLKKKLTQQNDTRLNNFKVSAANKQYEFWQRDSLAIHLFTKQVAYQKLDYIHYNPCAERWQLVNDPCEYKYSSAKFYELGIKEFDFLKDLREEF